MSKCLPFALALMAFVVTGCPHNDYIVQLKPQGNTIERTLVFYSADGVNTNTGAPNYQTFDVNELAMITSLYSTNALTNNGGSYLVRGEFTNALPADVGGAGAYTNLTASMGTAGFYAERFRGNDDLAGSSEKHFQAADQLTDLIIGWSKTELTMEPGSGKLRQFLDKDFRRDLKNLGVYWWEAQLVNRYKTNASEEFLVRFGQYLLERGYFRSGEIPQLFSDTTGANSQPLMRRIQRLVADKMDVPETEPVPASLAFLTNKSRLDNSFSNYLAGTDAYRARLKQWEEDKKLKPGATRPEPSGVLSDGVENLVDFNLFGLTPDHLVVRLSLPSPPMHSNGRWDEAIKQIVWDTDIEGRTNGASLPVFCYASWSQADEEFQKTHLGKIALTGDALMQYCLWRSLQNAQRGGEWDNFLANLKPKDDLTNKIDAFRFSDERAQTATNDQKTVLIPSDYPRGLLKGALE